LASVGGADLLHPEAVSVPRCPPWRLNGFQNRDLVQELFGSEAAPREENAVAVCEAVAIFNCCAPMALSPRFHVATV